MSQQTLVGGVSTLTTVSRTRPVIVLNPCATTVTTFGVIVGSKAVPQYDAGGGVMMDEMLCRDEEHFDKHGEEIYLQTGQCSSNGECPVFNNALEQTTDIVTTVNDPPQLVLFGKPVVELTAGSPWMICLPGTPAGNVCDRGVDEMVSFDPTEVPESEYDPDNLKKSRITNKLVRVCAKPDGTGGAIFAETHFSLPSRRDLSDVCGFTTRVAGTFTIEYSFVDDAGQKASVTRQIIVKPDCGRILNPNNNKPEFLCENKKLDPETGLEDYVCSKNNFCEGDLVESESELVDDPPVITLTTVPGVIEKTVNIRQYQSYAPCKLDAATGVMQQPEDSFYGDKLCDPGFTAYDTLQKRDLGEIIETRKDLTSEVLACPPVECETLESCESHKYSKKGLTGCIDTSIQGPTRILYTVRDDSSQVTKAYRDIVIIAPCPTGYDYCPGVGDNPCQTTKVCENAAALSAAAAVTDEGTDYEPPEITRLLPEGPIMLEYGTNYLSSGNTPFEPCTNGASRDAAEASYTAGDGDGMQYACAMTAFDEFDDEDSTEFIQVRQVIVGSENYFNIEQQGSGVIPPAQYTYEYSVEDLAGNIATETVLINVVMRKYELYTGVELDTAQYNNATYVEEYKEEVATQYAETARTTQNFIFSGVGDVEFSNRVDDTNTGNTTFDLKVTYFELPEGFDADPSSTATGRRRSARRRSLLQSNLGSPSSSGTSSPTVDENAAVVASIKGEINAIAALLDGSTSDLQAVVTDLGVAGGNPAAYQQRVGDYWGTLLRVADDSFRDLQNQAQDTLRVLDSTISVQQQVLESVAELEILLKKQNDELKATLDAIGEGEGDALGAACEHRSGLGTAELFFNATKYSHLGSPPPSPAPPPSPPFPPPPPPMPPSPQSPSPPSPPSGSGRRLMSTMEEVETTERDEALGGARRELLARSSSSTSTAGGWTGAQGLLADWKGYDVLQGGVTEQYAAPSSYIGRRYVGNTNRMVGGILIHQVRNQMTECDGTRFKNISAACRSKQPSTEPFGVDPVFRRPEAGQSSVDSLYNVALEDFVADYYNTSAGSADLRMIGLDGVGTPFGFFHREVPGYQPGFPVYLDIAATRNNLGNMIQYIKDGLYIDHMTRSISAQAVTYNANLKQLANVMVIFSFTDAGSIEVSHKVTNMNVKWYTEWSDTNGDGVNDGTAQLILEVMLALMFVYAASLELAEIAGTIWDEMSVFRGLRLHFSNFWNILDAANIGLQLASVSIWIGYQATRRAELARCFDTTSTTIPAQPAANFLMPHKRSSGVVDDALDANATGLGGALAADAEHRWQLPTDEDGLRLLGREHDDDSAPFGFAHAVLFRLGRLAAADGGAIAEDGGFPASPRSHRPDPVALQPRFGALPDHLLHHSRDVHDGGSPDARTD